MVKTCRIKGERKSRQVTLMFKPSIYEAFQKVAYVKSMSSNALIGELVEEYVKTHQAEISQYDKENPIS